ncbi:MAG TPA: hypothetical protein PKN48_00675 [Bacteroidales bacterium]|nr:hypothetical protein [Bacteroidales bacterium]
MLIAHGEQLVVKAEVFDRNGNFSRSIFANNTASPQPHEIELIHRNVNGDIINTKSIPFRSFTANWAIFQYQNWSNAAFAYLNTAGASGTSHLSEVYIDCPYNNDNGGIQVGRSSSSPTVSDYGLTTKIANGVTTNQLDYSATVFEAPTYVAPYYSMTIRRVFTNYSGANVTVRETGIVGNTSSTFVTTAGYLLAHDTVDYNGDAINLIIGHEQSFEVKYKFRYDISSGFTSNYLKYLYAWMDTGNKNYDLIMTNGAVTANPSVQAKCGGYVLTTAGTYGTNTTGIVVGKGTAVAQYTDFQMDDTISHGSTTGKLLYGGQEYNVPVVDATGTYYSLKRAFVNDSAVAVDITEAGIIGTDEGAQNILHTHINFTGLTLQPTESVRIIFTFRTDV